MTLHLRLQQDPDISGLLTIRSLTIDDLAEARAVHRAAFRFSAKALILDTELDAALKLLSEPAYTDTLANTHLIGGFMDDTLVATAGWRRADGRDRVARISAVAVLPLFIAGGIGRRMLADIEARARAAGHREFFARALPHMLPFYTRMGYDIVQQGLKPNGLEPQLPVVALRKTMPAVVC